MNVYFSLRILNLFPRQLQSAEPLDIHAPAWIMISTLGRRCPHPRVDINFPLKIIISMPGRGYPQPGVNVHAWGWISTPVMDIRKKECPRRVEIYSWGWISTPGRGCPRPRVLYNRLNCGKVFAYQGAVI